jgi:hypothetical protein
MEDAATQSNYGKMSLWSGAYELHKKLLFWQNIL